MSATIDLRKVDGFVIPFLIIFIFALLIYFLPLMNIAIHSDVHWLFRLQVANSSLLASVPEGLKQFAGFPSGFWDGCGAYYQAFGRANCLDVVTFRWLATLAEGSNDRWFFAYLLFNTAGLTLLYYILRKLGVGVLFAAILVFGAMLAPSEPWMTPRVSEPKAALLFLVALAITLSSMPNRHWYAAAYAAGATMIKEPMVVSWFLVVVVAIGCQMDKVKFNAPILDRFKPIIAPHLAAAGVVILAYLSVMNYFEKRDDYVFFINERIPLGAFATAYWASLKPVWVKFDTWMFLILYALLASFAWFERRRRNQSMRIYTHGQILMILGVLVAIAGHGLVYYLTNRTMSDNRYLVPSNYYFLVFVGLAVMPLVHDTNRLQQWVVSVVALVLLLYAFNKFSEIRPGQWLLYLLGVALFLPALVYRGVYQRRIRDAFLTLAVWLVLLPFVALRVDTIFQEAGNARADQRSWQIFVEAVADLPKGTNVHLQFTDPYMIETAWGLQAEMLFRDRADLNLRLSVTDTSEYGTGNDLLKNANESFNYGKPMFGDQPGVVMISANRGGNRATVLPEVKTLGELVSVFMDSPIRYFQERYVQGKPGYLDFTQRTL